MPARPCISLPHQVLSDSSSPSVHAGSPEDIRWLQSVRLVEPFDCSPPEAGFWENVVVSLRLLLHHLCRSALSETGLARLSYMHSAVLRAGPPTGRFAAYLVQCSGNMYWRDCTGL